MIRVMIVTRERERDSSVKASASVGKLAGLCRSNVDPMDAYEEAGETRRNQHEVFETGS